jgi:uroporphyrinogen-III synthase
VRKLGRTVTETNFQGLRVMAFESRRANEAATLISTFDGRPLVAPALREVPLESNSAALDFAGALLRDEFDIVVFLTGVGLRTLVAVVEPVHSRDSLSAALARTRVVARGPKPLAVLRELKVPVWAAAAEPNTWRELLAALDAKAEEYPVRGARIAVLEYGESNLELESGLRERGASITAVPVYRWALPEDLTPLNNAVTAIANGAVDVVIFTARVQIDHLWHIASTLGIEPDVRRGLARMVVASIGPTTSDALRHCDLAPDLEASHPKMGVLITEAARHAQALLPGKRCGAL